MKDLPRTLLPCLFSLATLASTAAFAADFPQGPAKELTPGALCEKPDQRRYPERIAYCRRDVDVSTKEEVVSEYDSRFGYRIAQIGRDHFKIDHYIPLCMGGGNDIDNLWPQHLSISAVTDKLEEQACNQMSRGKLLQARAVEMIRAGKADLSKVPALLAELARM